MVAGVYTSLDFSSIESEYKNQLNKMVHFESQWLNNLLSLINSTMDGWMDWKANLSITFSNEIVKEEIMDMEKFIVHCCDSMTCNISQLSGSV